MPGAVRGKRRRPAKLAFQRNAAPPASVAPNSIRTDSAWHKDRWRCQLRETLKGDGTREATREKNH